jgi:hypothetical protein
MWKTALRIPMRLRQHHVHAQAAEEDGFGDEARRRKYRGPSATGILSRGRIVCPFHARYRVFAEHAPWDAMRRCENGASASTGYALELSLLTCRSPQVLLCAGGTTR